MIQTVRAVLDNNAHLVGIALQCPPEVDLVSWLESTQSVVSAIRDLLIVPSFSAGQVVDAPASIGRALRSIADTSGRTVLVTTPSADRTISERVEATRLALSIIRKATRNSRNPWRVGIDRRVTLDFLRRLDRRPDFVVVGSALSNGNLSRNTYAFRQLLG